jgi:hypothetical protein
LKAEQNVSFTHWIPGKMQEMIKWDGMNLWQTRKMLIANRIEVNPK